MTKIRILGFTLALFTLFFAVALTQARLSAETVNVSFVLSNDLDTIEIGETRGGFARLAGLVARERADRKNVVVVNAGDAISPSLLSGFDHGAHIIELFNMIGLDLFVPGNHEFDYGPEVFRQRIGEAKFPVLAANLREADGTQVAGVEDSVMLEFDGVRIGVVGLTSDDAYTRSSPGAMVVGGYNDTLAREAAKLREAGADVVVAVAHANRTADMEIVRTREADLVLSGDDHDVTVFFDGFTALAESKVQAEMIAIVDLAINIDDKDGKRTVSWWPNFRIVDTADISPDPAVADRIDRFNRELSNMLDLELGVTDIELDSRRAVIRNGEAAIGNLVADALRTGTGADVAITNAGGIRGEKVYPVGTLLTRRDILTELPFGNRTVVVEITGAQMREALENGISDIENVAGRFPQVSGITFVGDLSKPVGERVLSVSVGGQPLDEARAYTVATNEFMLRGGDGYSVFTEGKPIIPAADGKLMTSEVIAYVQAHGTSSAKKQGRITLR